MNLKLFFSGLLRLKKKKNKQMKSYTVECGHIIEKKVFSNLVYDTIAATEVETNASV